MVSYSKKERERKSYHHAGLHDSTSTGVNRRRYLTGSRFAIDRPSPSDRLYSGGDAHRHGETARGPNRASLKKKEKKENQILRQRCLPADEAIDKNRASACQLVY